jgi:hypothetical protein
LLKSRKLNFNFKPLFEMRNQSQDVKALLKQELLTKIGLGISPSSIKNFRSLNWQEEIGRVNVLKQVYENQERTNRKGCVNDQIIFSAETKLPSKSVEKMAGITLVKDKGKEFFSDDKVFICEKRKQKEVFHNKSKDMNSPFRI